MTARLEPCEKAVACPRCYAQPGYACRGGRGILIEPHRQRLDAYATAIIVAPRQCAALTASGKPCRGAAAKDSPYCGPHRTRQEVALR